MTFNVTLPLEERLKLIDHIQARRYSKLTGPALDIATEGILRHLRACDRMDVNPDVAAVREIIDDALNGRRVFAETVTVDDSGIAPAAISFAGPGKRTQLFCYLPKAALPHPMEVDRLRGLLGHGLPGGVRPR